MSDELKPAPGVVTYGIAENAQGSYRLPARALYCLSCAKGLWKNTRLKLGSKFPFHFPSILFIGAVRSSGYVLYYMWCQADGMCSAFERHCSYRKVGVVYKTIHPATE